MLKFFEWLLFIINMISVRMHSLVHKGDPWWTYCCGKRFWELHYTCSIWNEIFCITALLCYLKDVWNQDVRWTVLRILEKQNFSCHKWRQELPLYFPQGWDSSPCCKRSQYEGASGLHPPKNSGGVGHRWPTRRGSALFMNIVICRSFCMTLVYSITMWKCLPCCQQAAAVVHWPRFEGVRCWQGGMSRVTHMPGEWLPS